MPGDGAGTARMRLFPAAHRAAAGVFFLCLVLAPATAAVQVSRSPVPAPVLTGALLEGGQFDLRRLHGRPVLVHFWASFCTPCLEELPSLQRLAARCPDLAVVTVAADRGSPAPVREVVRRLALTLPVVVAPEPALRRRWEVNVLPVTYLLDREHRLRVRVLGARRWDGAAGRAWLAEVMWICGNG